MVTRRMLGLRPFTQDLCVPMKNFENTTVDEDHIAIGTVSVKAVDSLAAIDSEDDAKLV